MLSDEQRSSDYDRSHPKRAVLPYLHLSLMYTIILGGQKFQEMPERTPNRCLVRRQRACQASHKSNFIILWGEFRQWESSAEMGE